MLQEIVISGFGGQGVLSMGKILAYSGIMEDKEVSWMPLMVRTARRNCQCNGNHRRSTDQFANRQPI